MEESAILKRDVLLYDRQSKEASRDFSEHSDLEPFLMTAEELESQHGHHLRYRERVRRREWMKEPV
jgi:hypothetical protein